MGVFSHGDSNGARNILLRHLTLHCKLMLIEKKRGVAFYEAGPLHARVPMVLSVCVAILLCSFVNNMISFCKLKIKRSSLSYFDSRCYPKKFCFVLLGCYEESAINNLKGNGCTFKEAKLSQH